MNAKWKKVRAGCYVLEGTKYGVACDGYPASNSIAAEGDYEGFTGGEWATILVDRDENLDWFSTMREARAYAEKLAAREADAPA